MKIKPFRLFVLVAMFAFTGIGRAVAADAPRPNILWLVGEDANVKWFGCYGSKSATTPNIDKFATQGFRYTNAFATAPVCAPSRSGWITGVYAVSTGTHPMRSRYEIPHDLIHYYPDYLREAGYFCSNHTKTDYNIAGRPDMACWDTSAEYGWRQRKAGQPFFCVINYIESHESRAFGSVENTRHDPAKTVLEKYHPDVPEIRKNYALYEDAVENMDQRVGIALEVLKRSGLEDDTIVIFCTDHGGVMPRSKHFVNETGLHAPLIVRIPEKFKHLWPAEKPGTVVDRLVSFIDFPKTWLSITGAQVPDVMQGRVFLGPKAEPEPEYAFSFRGRMDERYDESRTVRDKRFMYIKNYMPFTKWGQHLQYLWRMVAMQKWEELFKEGKTNDVTGLFFKTKPWVEELYDCQADSDGVVNLSTNPEYRPVLERMRKALADWQLSVHDSGLLPEDEMVRRAKEHHMTIYQMVRDAKVYNLPAFMAASDIALAANQANQSTLVGYLGDSDSGLRYWGATGLMMLKSIDAAATKALHAALKDESHDVRIMAAWALIKAGDQKEAQECLIELLKDRSYAIMKVMNVIDWMGVSTVPYLPAVGALSFTDSEVYGEQKQHIQDYLLHPDKKWTQNFTEEKQDEEKLRKALQHLKDAKGVPFDEKIP